MAQAKGLPASPLDKTDLKGLILLELRMQFRAFQSAVLIVMVILILSIGLPLLNDGLDFRSVAGFAFAISAFLIAIILGLSAGQGTGDYSESEASNSLQVASACLAGVFYLSPVVFLYCLFQVEAGFSNTHWIVPSIYKLYLTCFIAASWNRPGVLAASIALICGLVDVLFSYTLWSVQQDFSAEFVEYGTPLFLVPARNLMDLLFAILAIYASIRAVRLIYHKRESILIPYGLCSVCLLYGPVTSWLIFEFLLTPGQHQSLPWPFPYIVIFRIGGILYS
jgi:hypothetical protein